MTNTTNVRDAWEDAFDIADDRAQTNIHRFERVQRAALARKAAGGAGSGRRPAPLSSAITPPAEVVTDPTRWAPEVSRHCAKRLQQRGIAMADVAAVLAYGREQRSHGVDRLFLDRQGRARMQAELPDPGHRIERLDIQIVAGDNNRIVTVAHRTAPSARDAICNAGGRVGGRTDAVRTVQPHRQAG